MKSNFFSTLCGFAFLTILMTGCQKEELITNDKLEVRAPACTPSTPSWTNTNACTGTNVTVTFCNG